MEYLARLNIITVLMSTTFWMNLGIVFFVTLVTFWLINRLMGFVYKTIQRADKRESNGERLRYVIFDTLKKNQ